MEAILLVFWLASFCLAIYTRYFTKDFNVYDFNYYALLSLLFAFMLVFYNEYF